MIPDLTDRLTDVGAVTRHGDAEVLFSEGDPPHSVFAVLSGEVRIEISTPTGRRLVLAAKHPGELVGELGALDGRARSARAVAVGPTEVRRIGADDFVDALERDGRAAVALLRSLASELRVADRRTATRNSADVTTRLAVRLEDLARHRRRPGPEGTEIELRLTQEDLAAWIGATREATARSLRTLREAGLVRTGRGLVVVVDLDDLAGWSR